MPLKHQNQRMVLCFGVEANLDPRILGATTMLGFGLTDCMPFELGEKFSSNGFPDRSRPVRLKICDIQRLDFVDDPQLLVDQTITSILNRDCGRGRCLHGMGPKAVRTISEEYFPVYTFSREPVSGGGCESVGALERIHHGLNLCAEEMQLLKYSA